MYYLYLKKKNAKSLQQEAQLPQRDRATRHVKETSCYFSLGMGIKKVSNSKSDFQGHSRRGHWQWCHSI